MKENNQFKPALISRISAVVAVVLSVFLTVPLSAQTPTREITGKVVDENNEALPGVTVMVENTLNATMTDGNGIFALSNVPDEAVVIFTSIGYVSQRFQDARSVYNVSLVPDQELLEEAVLVAYGQQKKVSITGAISTVTPQDLRKTSTTRLDNALAGRLSGLSSMQTGGGQPGSDGATMYLRGAATTNGQSPLIIVDGVERDNIRTIDMNEVESLSVLKDASATALYGVQGANGVIVIQTRKGQKGAPQLSVTYDHSWTSFTKEPSRLHSWDYMTLRNQALANDGIAPEYSDEVIQKFKDPLHGLDPSQSDYEEQVKIRNFLYCDNDYYRMYLKSYTPQDRVNLNVSGGTDFVKYFINVGYIHQGGNLNTESASSLGYDPQCYMNRLSLRSNLDFQLARNLTASLNIASYIEDVNMPLVGSLYGGDESWMMIDLIYQSTTITPISPGPTTIAYGGVDAGYAIGYNYLDRTAFEIINRRGFHTNKLKNLNTQFSMSWDLGSLVTEGLSLNGMVAYDTYNRGILEGSVLTPIYTVSPDYDNDTFTYSLYVDQNQEMQLSKSKSANYQLYAQVSLNYAHKFGKHDVTGLLLANRKYWETTSAEIPYNILGTSARATYSYDDRYLAEINLGYNGSEQFSPSKRFGLFPAFSAGWIASNENFLKDNRYLTWLKLRASYGLVGNDSMGGTRFLYQDNITVSGSGEIGGLGGYEISEGLLGNKDITWELSKKLNLGIEVGILKDFRVSFDYFKEHRDQILITRHTIPYFQGVLASNIPKVNMGIVDNHGFEVEGSYSHSINRDFSFSIKGNFGFNDNVVVEYDEAPGSDDYVYPYRTEGFRLGQLWGYEIDWDSPGKGYFLSQEEIDSHASYGFGNPRVGDFVYKDTNGDGVVDVKDQVPIGYSGTIPGITYGLGLEANFKGFDFNVLFSGVGRYSMFYSDQGVVDYTRQGTYYDWTRTAFTLERFENGEKITYPALATGSTTSHVENDFFIQNRSFLRLKNIELGYTLPFKFLDKMGVKSLRVYLSGQNLFVLDGLRVTHLDPEQSSAIAYPITRQVSLGVNANF